MRRQRLKTNARPLAVGCAATTLCMAALLSAPHLRLHTTGLISARFWAIPPVEGECSTGGGNAGSYDEVIVSRFEECVMACLNTASCTGLEYNWLETAHVHAQGHGMHMCEIHKDRIVDVIPKKGERRKPVALRARARFLADTQPRCAGRRRLVPLP